MKPPTEADLQQLENKVLREWRTEVERLKGYGPPDHIVNTLEYLIARARYHNQREAGRRAEKSALNTIAQVEHYFNPPRNGKPEPVSSLQPKQKNR